jgi:hypothetical protein
MTAGDEGNHTTATATRVADDRLAAIESEHVEQLAKAHAALAAAQDRSYWLDRWGLDLNALMRRPAAGRVRAALRAVREVKRAWISLKRYLDTRLGDLRSAKAEDELTATANQNGSQAGNPRHP